MSTLSAYCIHWYDSFARPLSPLVRDCSVERGIRVAPCCSVLLRVEAAAERSRRWARDAVHATARPATWRLRCEEWALYAQRDVSGLVGEGVPAVPRRPASAFARASASRHAAIVAAARKGTRLLKHTNTTCMTRRRYRDQRFPRARWPTDTPHHQQPVHRNAPSQSSRCI